MEKDITKILEEIYALDNDLRAHEPELKKIIIQIIESRPDTKFDERFAKELRFEVLKRAKALKAAGAAGTGQGFWAGFLNLPKFAYVLGGAAIALVIMLPFMSGIDLGEQAGRRSDAPAISFGEGVKKLDSRAFGFLTMGTDGALKDRTGALGLGGGGGAAPEAAESARADIGIMPPFETVAYEYVYEGSEISQSSPARPVYQRTKTDAGSQALAQYVAGLNFSLADLKKFTNTRLTNLNLTEDREYGYIVNLNLIENTMDIHMNWEKWPRPENQCRDERCFAQYQVKIEDVPASESVIALANKFMSDYNIDLRGYGEPQVIDSWRRMYELADNKTDFYIPEDITVVYPLLIDGETVYDASGQPSGLYVGVNIRFNRVSNVNSITPQSYESSMYAALTEAAEILKIAEQGGLYPDYRPENPERTVEVKLGTPILGLFKYWSYDSEQGTGGELLVPAYIFPVTNLNEIRSGQFYFYREHVIVPLIEEIADQIQPAVGVLFEPAMPGAGERALTDEGPVKTMTGGDSAVTN